MVVEKIFCCFGFNQAIVYTLAWIYENAVKLEIEFIIDEYGNIIIEPW